MFLCLSWFHTIGLSLNRDSDVLNTHVFTVVDIELKC